MAYLKQNMKETNAAIKVFNDLLATIKRNAVKNETTITNVKVFCEAWKEELESEIKTQKLAAKKK